MKLIGSLTSPYVRKARIVLAEKKIEYDLDIQSPWDEDSVVPDYNPLGKIPVLVLDDGTPLFDSRVIVEYIDNVTPNNKLFPAPNRERTEVKRWEALADGVLDAAVAARLESQRPAGEQSKTFIRRQREKVMKSLAFMARELGEQSFCMGTPMTLADIAVGTSLGYLLFRFPDIEWGQAHPNLARLYDKLAQRPSFQDTLPQE
ncbi:glutathione S-transferase [Azovibrio restrictus]|uniref:glutathione S-transferase n=1 Tax=Azovibrio restrictus TaxID=146938 RepID=UPI0026E91DE3|nr:glutathione S-transferase [Azovibrio restrictus]MDD3483868.1 glutathione S-transferase [Azovibrio restrictus]